MDELQKAAKIGFASTFSFYLKAHNFHWNIVGADFYEYHKLLELIYDEVYNAIDPFAEKIRAMGAFVPGSFTRFSMLTAIDDEVEVLDQVSMIAELASDNEKMIHVLKMVYDLAEAAGEHGFSNFLAERMDAHRKHGWMLKASLK